MPRSTSDQIVHQSFSHLFLQDHEDSRSLLTLHIDCCVHTSKDLDDDIDIDYPEASTKPQPVVCLCALTKSYLIFSHTKPHGHHNVEHSSLYIPTAGNGSIYPDRSLDQYRCTSSIWEPRQISRQEVQPITFRLVLCEENKLAVLLLGQLEHLRNSKLT